MASSYSHDIVFDELNMFYKDKDSSMYIDSNVNLINFDEIENIPIDEVDAHYAYNSILTDVPCEFSDIKFSSKKQEWNKAVINELKCSEVNTCHS